MNSKRIHSMAGTRQRQAAILLEVLVSLGLLTFGLSVVGMRIRYALDSARLMNTWSRGILLADAKMAELQAGAVKFKTTDDELKGYFGVRYPGYSWRIRIKPTQTTDLFFVTLHIGFNGRVVESQRDNPEQEIDIDQEGTKIIRTLYRLEPKPADLNLSRDFGIPVDELMNGAAGAETGGGGASGDAAGGAAAAAQGAMGEFMQMVLEFLTAHPELLNETGGIDLQAMSELPAEDFQTAMQLMQQFLQTGQNFEALQQQFEQSLNGERQGGRRGGRRGGGRDGQGGRGGPDGQGSPDGGANVDGGGRPDGGRG